MLHVEVVGQFLAVAHEVANLLCRLHHVLRSLVGSIVQCTVFQQVIFKIGRVKFADKRAVHIERSDTILGRDEVRRCGVRHVLYVVLQRRQSLALVPQREVLLRRRGYHGFVVIVLGAR